MKKKMARQIGVDEDADDRCMALGALRMIHDVCAVATERVGDSMLEDYGYTIDGFSQGLKQPAVSTAIDSCLQEIAEENAELLEYAKSPYTRLLIAYAHFLLPQKTKENNQGCYQRGTPAARTVRRCPPQGRVSTRQNPIRGRGRGRAAHGQKHPHNPPSPENVKSV